MGLGGSFLGVLLPFSGTVECRRMEGSGRGARRREEKRKGRQERRREERRTLDRLVGLTSHLMGYMCNVHGQRLSERATVVYVRGKQKWKAVVEK